ncbi:MAG: SDR family NAD(P)-dependent oxidoreductase, partial [Actinobacteria bacterium]
MGRRGPGRQRAGRRRRRSIPAGVVHPVRRGAPRRVPQDHALGDAGPYVRHRVWAQRPRHRRRRPDLGPGARRVGGHAARGQRPPGQARDRARARGPAARQGHPGGVRHPRCVRNLTDTVVLVTGSTDGLGRAVAERLAVDGATVLIHGRESEKLASTAHELRSVSGNDRVRTYVADFASLEQVRAMAHEVEAENHRLHVLINNAGVGSGKPAGTTRQESADGYELRFAVNHLASFVLTTRLL